MIYRYKWEITVWVIVIFAIVYFTVLYFILSHVFAQAQAQAQKSIIIIFDRGYDNQFTNAKPILDKYGFKATFFITCGEIGNRTNYMNWTEIQILQKEGHAIESHGMKHKNLTNMSPSEIAYEVGQGKQCMLDKGFRPTFIQFPYNEGHNNESVINIVKDYFDYGLSNHGKLMPLNFTNPYYEIKEWSHDRYHARLNDRYELIGIDRYKQEISNLLFNKFVSVVESQNATVNIPIISYHNVGSNNVKNSSTSIELFDKEMNYLYSNGYRVIKLMELID